MIHDRNGYNQGCRCETCREAHRVYSNKYRSRNRTTIKRSNLSRYGLTYENYQQMLESQKNLCAVCEQPELHSNQFGLMALSVDHCHKTGKVRKLLCSQCNRAMGLLRDSPDIIRRLYEYRSSYD